MKRPLSSKRFIGPFRVVGRGSDIPGSKGDLVVRFQFNEQEGFGVGDPFNFETQDPEGAIEEDIKDVIESVFTESELQFLTTEDNEIIYRAGGTLESQQFGQGVVVWNRSRSTNLPNSNIEEVNQKINDLSFVDVPELNFVTVSKLR